MSSRMARCEKLLLKAQSSPNNFRFTDLCKLAECFGWKFKRQDRTSHRIYVNERLTPEQGRRMNFQDYKGKAMPYQVKQLLTGIENLTGE